jgi:hypothetical protein
MEIEDNSFAETLGEIAENMAQSDGFVMIPMSLINNDTEESLHGVETSVQFYERIQLGEDDEILFHMFMAAMVALIQTCFNRFDSEKVVEVVCEALRARADALEAIKETKH